MLQMLQVSNKLLKDFHKGLHVTSSQASIHHAHEDVLHIQGCSVWIHGITKKTPVGSSVRLFSSDSNCRQICQASFKRTCFDINMHRQCISYHGARNHHMLKESLHRTWMCPGPRMQLRNIHLLSMTMSSNQHNACLSWKTLPSRSKLIQVDVTHRNNKFRRRKCQSSHIVFM